MKKSVKTFLSKKPISKVKVYNRYRKQHFEDKNINQINIIFKEKVQPNFLGNTWGLINLRFQQLAFKTRV
ncbi:hypothetical protein ASJ81_05485 [Methanosarcina spelaei]|uniref:Uncharacterized protein n=1 Tax=Methanosarcina spelaei TaxID=1036679 RepID=A0A2A2HTY4_9EURY|nr:hypothetical protein ASJ81_05485 [Methanosarcina spelaei]